MWDIFSWCFGRSGHTPAAFARCVVQKHRAFPCDVLDIAYGWDVDGVRPVWNRGRHRPGHLHWNKKQGFVQLANIVWDNLSSLFGQRSGSVWHDICKREFQFRNGSQIPDLPAMRLWNILKCDGFASA